MPLLSIFMPILSIFIPIISIFMPIVVPCTLLCVHGHRFKLQLFLLFRFELAEPRRIGPFWLPLHACKFEDLVGLKCQNRFHQNHGSLFNASLLLGTATVIWVNQISIAP